MYKISPTKLKILGAVAGLLILAGLIFGGIALFSNHGTSSQSSQLSQNKQVSNPMTALNQDSIMRFLEAYYNRQDFGDNQSVYKPFVTDSVFNQLTANDDVQGKIQKGYIVNRRLVSAQIFIDSTNNEVLCTSNYTFIQRLALPTKANPNPKQSTVSGKETLDLNLQKDTNGNWVIGQIQAMSMQSAPLGQSVGSGQAN